MAVSPYLDGSNEMNIPRDKYMAEATPSNIELSPEFHKTKLEPIWLDGHFHFDDEGLLVEVCQGYTRCDNHVTADMRYAVARDSIATGERLGYVAGLAENAGTWNVAMTFDSAVAEVDRLNALDDGCQYWAVCYKGDEE